MGKFRLCQLFDISTNFSKEPRIGRIFTIIEAIKDERILHETTTGIYNVEIEVVRSHIPKNRTLGSIRDYSEEVPATFPAVCGRNRLLRDPGAGVQIRLFAVLSNGTAAPTASRNNAPTGSRPCGDSSYSRDGYPKIITAHGSTG